MAVFLLIAPAASALAQSCTPVGSDGQACISDGPSHTRNSQTFGHHTDISFNNGCDRYIDVQVQTTEKNGRTTALTVTVPSHGTAGWACDEVADCVDLTVIGPVCKDGDVSGGRGVPPAGRATSTEDLEKARQAAEDARQKALDAIAETQRVQKEQAQQKAQMKEQADASPDWCSGMIRTCREQTASLSNASPETQSQCTVYCQNLEIQKCDGTSSLLNQAAQACNDGMSRDRKLLAEQTRKKREDAKIRQAAPPPDPTPAPRPRTSEWTCFQSYESCTGYCMAQTGATGTAGWCGGICSGSGTGNRPQPSEYGSQYCYHAPETPEERANVY